MADALLPCAKCRTHAQVVFPGCASCGNRNCEAWNIGYTFAGWNARQQEGAVQSVTGSEPYAAATGSDLRQKLPSRFQIGDTVRYENMRGTITGVTFLLDKVLYDLRTKHGPLLRTPSEHVQESFECVEGGPQS